MKEAEPPGPPFKLGSVAWVHETSWGVGKLARVACETLSVILAIRSRTTLTHAGFTVYRRYLLSPLGSEQKVALFTVSCDLFC